MIIINSISLDSFGRLSLDFSFDGDPVSVYWMDSPMGGELIYDNIGSGTYTRNFDCSGYPTLYGIWFWQGGVPVLEIPAADIPETIPEIPSVQKSNIGWWVLAGVGLIGLIIVAKQGK